jgi:hypothetical protein
MTIADPGLGQVPASVANASAKIGVCSDGVVGTVYSANDNGTAANLLGQGPLVDAMAHTLSVAGGPVFALPINPSAAGSASAVTRGVQIGTGTLTVSLAPRQSIAIKIGTGGTNGTATFSVSLGGGAYGSIVATTGGTFAYAVPGTLTTITLASGQTWVAADIYTVATDGTVTLSGSGPAASNVTHADSPLDAYSVLVTVITTGALGAGVFSYSIDGGNSVSGQILIPSGGKYAIPGTGVVLVFSGTFTAGDTYTFTTTTAGFSNSDVTAALTTLLAAPIDFGFVHIVGMGANSAAAAATAAVVQTAMGTAEAGFRYMFAVTECPTSESDATVAAAFGTTVAIRIGVCAGDAALISPLNGRILRRNLAWVYSARLALIPAGEDPGFVGRGALPNVKSIYRDEQATPLLDASRFVTLRTFPGRPGYFVTNGNMMASPGSDFNLVQRRRVMDVACKVVRNAEMPFLNGSVRVDPKTGFIDERDAQTFENTVNSQLRAAVVATGMASSSSVVMNRTTNILATNSEPVTVRILPLAYLKQIQTNIGFTNPAALAA